MNELESNDWSDVDGDGYDQIQDPDFYDELKGISN